MSKKNEILQYATISKNTMVVIRLPYLERRNLKYRARDIRKKHLDGFPRYLSWKRVSRSEIELFKDALDTILYSNVVIYVIPIKDSLDGLEKLQFIKDEADRTYVSERHYVHKDNSLFFVPIDESVVTQLASLIGGIHSYMDRYYELEGNANEDMPAKYQLADYFFGKKDLKNIKYL